MRLPGISTLKGKWTPYWEKQREFLELVLYGIKPNWDRVDKDPDSHNLKIEPDPKKKSAYLRRKEREALSGPGWTEEQWKEFLEVNGAECAACGATDRLVPDHVVPLYRKGTHDLSNIQVLCWGCNTKKGLRIIRY